MNEIYIPNIFRFESFRTTNTGNTISEIPYRINFNLSEDTHLKAMMQLELANALENLLLFDTVYVDPIALPILIDLMYQEDPKGTIKAVKKGCISFINCKDMSIFVNKDIDCYSLAYGCGTDFKLSNLKNLESLILNYGVPKQKLRPYIQKIFNKKKDSSINIDELGINIVNQIQFELKSKTYSDLGIGINGNYAINDSNKGIFDTICQVVRAEAICSSFNINSIDFSDIVLEISKVRSKQHSTVDEKFNSLLYLNDIPDISKLYLEGSLNIYDIMQLRSTSEFKAFKQWFFDNKDNPADSNLVKAYCLATRRQSKLDSIPVRCLRWMVTTAAGVNPLVGFAASAIDSFGLDMLKKSTPDLFFNDIEKRLKKNSNISQDLETIEIPFRNIIEIDLSDERTLDMQDFIYNKLLYIANQISCSSDENAAIQYFQEGESLYFKEIQTKKTLESYLSCAVNLSSKSTNYCLKFINDLGIILSNLKNAGDQSCVDIIQDSYMSILLNGIFKGYENLALEKIVSFIDKDLATSKIGYAIRHIMVESGYSDEITVKKLASILMYILGKTDKLYDTSNIKSVKIDNYNNLDISFIR
ncbi:MAG: hypothetical protein ACRDC3_08595 [Paraclostridium dentum]|uniref:hypothetical protein n=1 Tax=Paraclostridium dentum TaxID=2662455 RepID=UPI003EE4AA3A